MRVPKGDTWAVWLQNIRAFAGSHVRNMTNVQRIEGYAEAQFSPFELIKFRQHVFINYCTVEGQL